MAVFKWTRTKEKAANLLGMGATNQEAAKGSGVSERTIYRWKEHDIFRQAIDKQTMAYDLARRAGRLRIAYRAVAARTENSQYPQTRADLLDWLKFLQSETDGTQDTTGQTVIVIERTGINTLPSHLSPGANGSGATESAVQRVELRPALGKNGAGN